MTSLQIPSPFGGDGGEVNPKIKETPWYDVSTLDNNPLTLGAERYRSSACSD